ncbi:hypothetical protein G4B88_009438 [Cannabis sativa]|uniref:AB hydrolase-1 domain-containing protein n=1 Tax=Cannabis sativa TaxID=3483 RepID=A0A7J6F4X4_CANSA|nr:hypothetical protein G4B88_009438 [Cannabis sativa]
MFIIQNNKGKSHIQIYVVGFDRPSYGESDPDPNRTVKSLALDVENLVDPLGLGSKFYVMGFSMGGQAIWGCLKYISNRKFKGPDHVVLSRFINQRRINSCIVADEDNQSPHVQSYIQFIEDIFMQEKD